MDGLIKTDQRFAALKNWLSSVLSNESLEITLLTGDASFRRYFRIKNGDDSFIAMDAPPNLENSVTFVAIAEILVLQSIHVPKILTSDLQQGFLLITDLGDRQLLSQLNTKRADYLYSLAMNNLLQLQTYSDVSRYPLPAFDAALYWKEFDIFYQWFLKTQCGVSISVKIDNMLRTIYQSLIDEALMQPIVFVHRDYHSRNLMLCNDNQIGVLDFQDAVWGPITYDLASLLQDCYIAWPRTEVEKWVRQFYQQLLASKRLADVSFPVFLRWFDWIGLQRHIKCLGIFSRLSHRDGKTHYLKDIPLVLRYVMCVCDRYAELLPLKHYLESIIVKGN